MKRRPTAADGSKLERRKETRFPVSIPVEVSWKSTEGGPMKHEGVARQVNARGGLVEMGTYPELGTRVAVTNLLSAESAEARVLATPNSREGVAHGIVVELVMPDESFWGASLQVKKAAVELQRLEKLLRAQNVDLRLLKEFRDGVDYLQAIAGSVQQARERQIEGEDENTESLLVGERIRRTINFCLEVIADFDAGRIGEETKGLAELLESVEQISQRFRSLLAPDRSRPVRNVQINTPEPAPVSRRGRAEPRGN
ncbi:MAG TPA: hypothetical protein VFB23_04435 [Candidatus Acidoferrales bacterium]|nr:hypothetical protein [Candidatus Acidoferrales bacterium]